MGYAQEKGGALRLWFNYNSDVFESATIRRFLGYFKNLLVDITRNVAIPVSQLALLSEEEMRHQLETFNQTNVPYPQDQSGPHGSCNRRYRGAGGSN